MVPSPPSRVTVAGRLPPQPHSSPLRLPLPLLRAVCPLSHTRPFTAFPCHCCGPSAPSATPGVLPPPSLAVCPPQSHGTSFTHCCGPSAPSVTLPVLPLLPRALCPTNPHRRCRGPSATPADTNHAPSLTHPITPVATGTRAHPCDLGGGRRGWMGTVLRGA